MICARRINEDIENLQEFTSTPGHGVTRLSYSPEGEQARKYLIDQMLRAGLSVFEHPAGNVIGRLAGRDDKAPPVMTGSHYDTVRNGGAFDGICGVVAALEAARSMREDGFVPEYPLDIVAFAEEEGTRFGYGLLGSSLMLGLADPAQMDTLLDEQGISLKEALQKAGLGGKTAKTLQPGDLKAFVELHIEQGPVMERSGAEIGVVDRITSMSFGEVCIEGRADHAGTTPMDKRLDAMRGAARMIETLFSLAEQLNEGMTATVGKLLVSPGSGNVVPEKVTFSIDFRCSTNEKVQDMSRMLKDALQKLDAATGLTSSYHEISYAEAVEMDPAVRRMIEQSADLLGCRRMRISSGAGHDAMSMAKICPTGMIFIPSGGGRSHCPEEFTDLSLIEQGARVLEDTLKQLCGR